MLILNTEEGLNIGYTKYQLDQIGDGLKDLNNDDIGDFTESELLKQMGRMTSTFSYYREEVGVFPNSKPFINGNPDIEDHTEGYGISLNYWKDFFDGKIDLADIALNVHKVLLRNKEGKLNGNMPYNVGIFRNDFVVMTKKSSDNTSSERIKNSNFIAPNYTEILKGFELLQGMIVKHKGDDITLAGLVHYWITVIHPFDDGNGRIARILSISLLEHLGYKNAKCFTLIGESFFDEKRVGLKQNKSKTKVYDSGFSNDINFTRKLKENNLNLEGNIIENLPGIDYYFENLDPSTSVKSFVRILERLNFKKDYIIDGIKISLLSNKIGNENDDLKVIKLNIIGQLLSKMVENISCEENCNCKLELSKKIAKNTSEVSMRKILEFIDSLNTHTKKIKFQLSFDVLKILLDRGILKLSGNVSYVKQSLGRILD